MLSSSLRYSRVCGWGTTCSRCFIWFLTVLLKNSEYYDTEGCPCSRKEHAVTWAILCKVCYKLFVTERIVFRLRQIGAQQNENSCSPNLRFLKETAIWQLWNTNENIEKTSISKYRPIIGNVWVLPLRELEKMTMRQHHCILEKWEAEISSKLTATSDTDDTTSTNNSSESFSPSEKPIYLCYVSDVVLTDLNSECLSSRITVRKKLELRETKKRVWRIAHSSSHKSDNRTTQPKLERLLAEKQSAASQKIWIPWM